MALVEASFKDIIGPVVVLLGLLWWTTFVWRSAMSLGYMIAAKTVSIENLHQGRPFFIKGVIECCDPFLGDYQPANTCILSKSVSMSVDLESVKLPEVPMVY